MSVLRQTGVSPATLPFVVQPAEVVYRIEGSRYRVRVWTDAQWSRLREEELPLDAVRLEPIGWIETKRVSST